jgi:hypothetical protein
MTYSCVKFIENGAKKIMTVPSNWVSGNTVSWPPNRTNEKKHYKRCSDPEEDWLVFEITREIFRGKV